MNPDFPGKSAQKMRFSYYRACGCCLSQIRCSDLESPIDERIPPLVGYDEPVPVRQVFLPFLFETFSIPLQETHIVLLRINKHRRFLIERY